MIINAFGCQEHATNGRELSSVDQVLSIYAFGGASDANLVDGFRRQIAEAVFKQSRIGLHHIIDNDSLGKDVSSPWFSSFLQKSNLKSSIVNTISTFKMRKI